MQGLTRYVLALCLLAAPAFAEEESEVPGNQVTERDRVWVNYTRESAVVGSGKLRLGAQALLINKSTNDSSPDLIGFPFNDLERALEIAGTPDSVKSVDGNRFDLMGAYGLGPTSEIGFDLPILYQSIDFVGDTANRNDGDVGDLILYAKFRKMVSSSASIGSGLEMSIPTGPERKRLGTGDLAFNPFVNARYTRGQVAVGGHLGFNMSEGPVADVFNYGTFVIVRPTDVFALRLELNGRFFKDYGDEFNDVSLWPGIDLNVSKRITVRPQSMIHLTSNAWDWGIGLGVFVDLF